MITGRKTSCKAYGSDVHFHIEGVCDALITWESAEFLANRLMEAVTEAKQVAFAKNKLGMQGGTATFKVTDPNGKTTYLG